jgi:hypothetical protein
LNKKIYFFRFDTSRNEVFLPYIYFGFKSFYEQNSIHSDKWDWIPPVTSYIGWQIEDIIEEAISHKADVYAFNSYMWSWSVVKFVADRVKEALPNSVILLGGPHQGTTYSDTMFWFKK